ncbi:MAG: hypothetical protein HDQ87_09295 [Clostridia bacterium]|nr:hypothetical protein [Clostridia bacterium]
MAVLNLDQIIDLKKQVEEKFGETLHAHDTCGGQSFEVKEMTPELKAFLREYLRTEGLKAAFSETDGNFVVS